MERKGEKKLMVRGMGERKEWSGQEEREEKMRREKRGEEGGREKRGGRMEERNSTFTLSYSLHSHFNSLHSILIVLLQEIIKHGCTLLQVLLCCLKLLLLSMCYLLQLLDLLSLHTQ